MDIQTDVADQIIKVLDNLGQKFGMGINWTQENILPYVQELSQRIIKYEISMDILWLVIGLALLIPGSIMWYKILKYRQFEDKYTPKIIFGAIFIIFGTIITYCQITNLIQAIYLPEQIWLKYAQTYLPSLK